MFKGGEFKGAGPGNYMHYEDAFGQNESMYAYISDPIDLAQQQALQAAWAERKKIRHGPFNPAGGKLTHSEVTRALLPTIVDEIKAAIAQDWDGASFTLSTDADDFLMLRFRASSIESEKGLQTYMNIFVARGEIASRYFLSKAVDAWNHRPGSGEWIYFVLKPHWVATSINTTYYNLHPEVSRFDSTLSTIRA